MSTHAHLLLSGYAFDGEGQRHHEVLINERLNAAQVAHSRRIWNCELERRLITGDVWNDDPKADEHRVTSELAHRIMSMGAAMSISRAPRIDVQPTSESYSAHVEADRVQKLLHILVDRLRAVQQYQYLAKEQLRGAGVLHQMPWKLALEDEIPLQLDVPSSGSVLWSLGANNRIAHVFIKHTLSVNEARARMGIEPSLLRRQPTDEIDVWCYYSEERYLTPQGRVNKMILYGLLESGRLLAPLTDVTRIWPDIPVHLALNADGYNWMGHEHMRAYGVLTPFQEKLLYASDFSTRLANGMIKFVDPAYLLQLDPNSELNRLDLRSGAENRAHVNDRVAPLNGLKPDQGSAAFWHQFQRDVAQGTFPEIMQGEAKDLDGVSGSAMAEQLHPSTVLVQTRQTNLEYAIREQLVLGLKYLSRVIDPSKGMQLMGVDPRDHGLIQTLVHPDLLERHLNISVKLSKQSPRGVIQWVNMVANLAREHIIPMSMATEQVTQLMEMPVGDMTSITDQIRTDQMYKAKLQVFAQQLKPFVQGELTQQGLNPNILTDGMLPSNPGPEGQDPRLLEDVTMQGPVQQQAAMAAQGAMY